MKPIKNVPEYIAKADKSHQKALKLIRKIVKETVPDATEEIAYGIPAYKWNGAPLFYFAAMKGHLGLYPTSGPIKKLKSVLADFSTSKGCVRVPHSIGVPKNIIIKLLQTRLSEIK